MLNTYLQGQLWIHAVDLLHRLPMPWPGEVLRDVSQRRQRCPKMQISCGRQILLSQEKNCCSFVSPRRVSPPPPETLGVIVCSFSGFSQRLKFGIWCRMKMEDNALEARPFLRFKHTVTNRVIFIHVPCRRRVEWPKISNLAAEMGAP